MHITKTVKVFLKVDNYKYGTLTIFYFISVQFSTYSLLFFKIFEDLKQNFYRLLANSKI